MMRICLIECPFRFRRTQDGSSPEIFVKNGILSSFLAKKSIFFKKYRHVNSRDKCISDDFFSINASELAKDLIGGFKSQAFPGS